MARYLNPLADLQSALRDQENSMSGLEDMGDQERADFLDNLLDNYGEDYS